MSNPQIHHRLLPARTRGCLVIASVFVGVGLAGCEVTIPGGDGANDTGGVVDMSSNGTNGDSMSDSASADDDANAGDSGMSRSARIEIELTAVASEQDILNQLGITLDQTLTVNPIQSKATSTARVTGPSTGGISVVDGALTLDNTIAVPGDLVGGIQIRQVMIGVRFVETTPLPIAFPVDFPENEAIKAFTTLPPGGLGPLDDGDFTELPDLNDLEGGIIIEDTITPDLESFSAALIDSTIKDAITNAANQGSQNSVIAAPQVTAFDRQQVTFIHRNESAGAADLGADFVEALNHSNSDVPFVQSGFVLDLIPHVNDDGTIQLTIFPGTQGIVFAKNEPAQINGGQVFIELPVFQRSSVETTVSVPDGGTILLGGIKRLSEASTERGVPVLSNLPYINRLFSNTAVIRDSQSLLLMVTPRIIIQEEDKQ